MAGTLLYQITNVITSKALPILYSNHKIKNQLHCILDISVNHQITATLTSLLTYMYICLFFKVKDMLVNLALRFRWKVSPFLK